MNWQDALKRYQNMTPAQRSRVNAQLRVKWNSLTPSQRQQAMDKLRNKWNNLTPAQRHKVMAQLQSNYNKMTPWQKEKVRQMFMRGELRATGSQVYGALKAVGYSERDALNIIVNMLRRYGVSLRL